MLKLLMSSKNIQNILHAFKNGKFVQAQTQINTLSKQLGRTTRTIKNYFNIISGGTFSSTPNVNNGKVALPPPPKFMGRYVHEVWPCHTSISHTCLNPTRPIAANQTATATGDPHIKGGDGGRFDFQGQARRTYNLLNDTGLQVNARFRAWPNGGTAIGAVGIMSAGSGGYSRIELSTHGGLGVKAKINGRLLLPGQSIRLADGGVLHVSKNTKDIYIRSHEGYRIKVASKGHGIHAHLNVSIQSPRHGVAQDWRMPGGLLGHTFDSDKKPLDGAKGRNAQDEGAIDGYYKDYEVLGGLFSPPKRKIVKGHPIQIQSRLGPAYKQYFNLEPDTKFSDFRRHQIKELWNQLTNQMSINHLIQNTWDLENESQKQNRKLELLLMAALNSGNMDLAVLMLSSLETKAANQITRGLIGQIHTLQQKRQSLAAQMTEVGSADNAKGASKLRSLSTEAEGISTEISLLQTFLQDAMASKRNTQEFASNWIRQSHETTRSIIQNIGR